jgi:hypothetical protein
VEPFSSTVQATIFMTYNQVLGARCGEMPQLFLGWNTRRTFFWGGIPKADMPLCEMPFR